MDSGFPLTNTLAERVTTAQFLRVHLAPNTLVLLPVEAITEVLNFAAHHVVPVAHMASPVMGVYNWRGEILWMADLGQLLGLTPLYAQGINRQSYTAVVFYNQNHRVGLVVDRVEDMETLELARMNTQLTGFPPLLAQVAMGYILGLDGSTLVVLDPEVLIQQLKQQDRPVSPR